MTGPRVLWLEDDPALRKAFSMVASDLEADVRMAASHAEAREHLANDTFDWIVADYRMGGGTSERFVRKCVADGHRVVVLTGDATSVAADLPARVFEKPITVDRLLGALEESVS